MIALVLPKTTNRERKGYFAVNSNQSDLAKQVLRTKYLEVLKERLFWKKKKPKH